MVVPLSQRGGEGTLARPMSSESCWTDLLAGVDCVIHTAARVHVMNDTVENPLFIYRKINVDGTINLARQAASAGVKRFVFLSSAKVCGEGGIGCHEAKRECDAPSPCDPYSISKREAEEGLYEISRLTGLEIVVIRPPLVYGPGVKANFHTMMRWVNSGIPLPFGAINNKRSLVGVNNLVSFIMECIDHPAAANQTFFVSDGADVSTSDLLRKLACALGRPSRLLNIPAHLIMFAGLVFGKSQEISRLCGSLQLDLSKARQELGWSPPFSMDQELVETASHFLGKQIGQAIELKDMP